MKILKKIFPQDKIISIAEIGLNHNGSVDLAIEMVEKAAESGADAVKFQTYQPEKFYSLYTNSLLKGGIEKEKDSSQIDFFKKFVLSKNELIKIKEKAEKLSLQFFSTPFDSQSIDLLEDIGVKLYKIASSELTNHSLLEDIAKTKKPVILSTGMSKEEEIHDAISILKKGTSEIVLLHCVSLYPLENKNVNLLRMLKLKEKFQLEIGFSDHTSSTDIAVMAAFMGAKIIEKHFKFSEDFECPDQSVSLDPNNFKEMVEKLKECLVIRGTGNINYNEDEAVVANSARKSIFAGKFIPEGTVIKRSDLEFKRPGVGIPVYNYKKIIGKKTKQDIQEDFLIKEEYLI